MADYTDSYIYATIHEFKSNISRYIKWLEEERYRAVIVKRYNKPVGIFMTAKRPTEKEPENVD